MPQRPPSHPEVPLMDFDFAQFSSIAPLTALTIAGCVLLLLEAFGSGRHARISCR